MSIVGRKQKTQRFKLNFISHNIGDKRNFQQENSFYRLLNEGERSESLQDVPEDFFEGKTAGLKPCPVTFS